MLGLGDIAIPGLFGTFLLDSDLKLKSKWFSSFFILFLAGYYCGMYLTGLANRNRFSVPHGCGCSKRERGIVRCFLLGLFNTGQPALLYLVPCTILPVYVLAWWRGVFLRLFNGFKEKLDDKIQ